MAVTESEEPRTSRKKRKREDQNDQRKLLVDQRVEVRSVEDGFRGSWHSGIVVASDKKRLRRVRYDHLLTDDESGKLVEAVRVSPALDGIICCGGESQSLRHRGKIRPLPPSALVRNWDLHYGLCVDGAYMDAWWEGVIFDHEDGASKRRVFFPDLGDELTMEIEHLRITQDWDEVTGEWRRRGTWVLFELIEEFEQKCSSVLPVSVKQIWFDVREKRDFEKVKEWTCGTKGLWNKMVSEVCDLYFKFFAEELCRRLVCPGSSVPEAQEEMVGSRGVSTVGDLLNDGMGIGHGTIASDVSELVQPALHVGIGPEAERRGSEANLPVDRSLSGKQVTCRVSRIKIVHGKNQYTCKIPNELLQRDMTTGPSDASMQPGQNQLASVINCDVSAESHLIISNASHPKEALGDVTQVLPVSRCGISRGSPVGHVLDGITNQGSDKTIARPDHSACENTGKWHPLSTDVLPAAEFCPSAVDDYYKYFSEKLRESKSRGSLQVDVLKHLSHLGWKIEHSNEKRFSRKRYTSPGGKCMYSLIEVCKHLRESSGDLISSASPDKPRKLNASSNVVLPPLEQPQESQSPDCCPQTTTLFASSGGTIPDYCSQLVMEYHQQGKKGNSKILSNLRPKIKEQLVSNGWVLSLRHYKEKNRKISLYKSPSGNQVYSLVDACKVWYADMQERANSVYGRIPRIRFTVGCNGNSTGNTQPILTSGHGFRKKLVQPNTLSKMVSEESSLDIQKVKVKGIRKARRKRDGNLLHFAAQMFQSRVNRHAKRDVLQNSAEKYANWNQPKDQNYTHQKVKKRKSSSTFINLKDVQDDTQLRCVLRSSKRIQDVVIPNSSHRNPLSVVSWLIDNGTILPREKVRHINRKEKSSSVEGRINRKGIKCSCCSKLFSLGGFAVHAGGNHWKAAANIFLDDGRSILDCEKVTNYKKQRIATESHDRMKSNWRQGENDHICSVCHYGGELMLCDQCPASFHKSCLGLKEVPEGDWFCSSCCCRKCGVSKFEKDKEHSKDGSILTCSQCEHKYHVGCLKSKRLATIKSDSLNNWFCSKICKKIYFRLQNLLGKETTLDANNLTWSLLKTLKTNIYNTDSEVGAVETCSKLNVALSVMHECFKPVKEARTRRDLMEDVIFSRESDLQRLNFRGFYTVILARNDELISVATVRVHGKKVAEVPLVGTRLQYRRLGMCRILMKELEKKLMDLGVERLVLPAVPSVINTWTTSFGFSEMTASERLHFLDYTFLDFQGTMMCQKLLKNVSSTELSRLKGVQPGYFGDVCEDGENADIDRSSAVSEVYQAEQTEDAQIASQGQPEPSSENERQ